MPIFEYICNSCGKQTELLVRNKDEIVKCSCGSTDMKRLFSTFAVSNSGSTKAAGCQDGSCSLPSSSCESGLCGLS